MASNLPPDLGRCVERALAEDLGDGDITAELIPAASRARATIVCRESAVLCGTAWAAEVFRQLDPAVEIEWLAGDGDRIAPEQTIARLQGPARSLLSGERTGLNFLQTLSGTATISHDYARLVAHTGCRLLDTRKTLPGLRSAQKYAVRTGGCFNHRMGLYDAYLIKENHISACGSITRAVTLARQQHPDRPLEVEIERPDQLREALEAGADTIMLDNFTLEQLRETVQEANGRAILEASGNVEAQGLAAIAETGIDCISIGALTKQCRAVDLSMRFQDMPAQPTGGR